MIYFITLCDKKSYDEKRIYFLEKSFEKYGNISHSESDQNKSYTLITLQNYAPHYGNYNKIVQLYQYLRSSACEAKEDRDVILFMDGFDTLAMKPLEPLEADFRASTQDIIFGANSEFKYIYNEAKPYYDQRYAGAGSQKYLDSSFFIGYKFAILQLLQYIMPKLNYYPKPDGVMSDRRVLGYVFYQANSKEHASTHKVLQHLKMDLDYECKYFYTKGVNKGLDELLMRNPYFLQISSQERAYLLVAKLKDLL